MQQRLRARRGERLVQRVAAELQRERARVLSYLNSLVEPPFDSAEQRRWVRIYRDEFAEFEDTVSRLNSEPAGVSQREIDRAVAAGQDLLAILLSSRLRDYAGSWVAVRNNAIIDSAADPQVLSDRIEASGRAVDEFSWVPPEPELSEL